MSGTILSYDPARPWNTSLYDPQIHGNTLFHDPKRWQNHYHKVKHVRKHIILRPRMFSYKASCNPTVSENMIKQPNMSGKTCSYDPKCREKHYRKTLHVRENITGSGSKSTKQLPSRPHSAIYDTFAQVVLSRPSWSKWTAHGYTQQVRAYFQKGDSSW